MTLIEMSALADEQEDCWAAINEGLTAVHTKLGPRARHLLAGVTIQVGAGLTESGGETFRSERRIALDEAKSGLSLQEAEDLLTARGYHDTGDLVSVLPAHKDEPWGYTTYNVVHELGHLFVANVAPHLAPTKYGRERPNEVFPELFAYYVFGAPLSEEAVRAVEQTIARTYAES